MATERRIISTGLIVWMVFPIGLLVLDRLLFHLRGGEAWGYAILWLVTTAVSVIDQLVAAVKAVVQDRVVLALTLFLTAVASVMVPLIMITSRATNFWSPVFC